VIDDGSGFDFFGEHGKVESLESRARIRHGRELRVESQEPE
jgi:hypothetical protein